MFNIIEQQVKLNMKTETREERTPNTPIVADCMCKVSSFLWTAQHSSPLLGWVRHKVLKVVRRCGLDGWFVAWKAAGIVRLAARM